MPWFWVDDAFADSRPVMSLDRSLRNEAIGLWVRCGAWSAKEETDGRVPLDTAKSFDGTPRLIRALHEQAGLWVESSPESWRNSREILFGNWEKWQKTKAENEAKRKADAIRQANFRKGKKGRGYVPNDLTTGDDSDTSRRDTDRDSNPDDADGSEVVSRRESQCPDPTRPDPTLIPLVDSSGGVTQVAPTGPRPECHEHSENYGGPCRKCERRRKWDEANAEAVKADELDRKRKAREIAAACPLCKGTNLIEVGDNEVRKCDHQAARHA
ncbi:hypothetical protein [Mycolicibacterium setense]